MSKMRIFSLFCLVFAFSGCARLENPTVEKIKSGRQVEYVLIKNSASSDTVLFENGLAGKMDWWAKALPEISKSTTVFAYNRPGYGDSDAVTTPRDGEHVVNELSRSSPRKA